LYIPSPDPTDFASPAWSTTSSPYETSTSVPLSLGGSAKHPLEVPLIKGTKIVDLGDDSDSVWARLQLRFGLSNRSLFRLSICSALLAGVLLGSFVAVVAVLWGHPEGARNGEAWSPSALRGPLYKRHAIAWMPELDGWKPQGVRTRFDVMNRSVWVYRPHGANGHLPAVVVLHGSDDHALKIASTTRFESLADLSKHQFLVILPEMEQPGGISWGYEDDEPFFRAVIDKVAAEYLLIGTEVFVCGHSSGGTMALYLQNNMPEVFSASASVEAGVGHLEQWHNKSSGRPTMVVWNHNDNVLAEFGGRELYDQTLAQLRRHANQLGDFPVMQEALPSGAWEAGKHGALYAQRKVWAPTSDGRQPAVEVVSWASAAPTHNWLNPVRVPGATVDASVLIWEFFRAVSPKPGGGSAA